MSNETEDDEYETWVNHDPIGVTHFVMVRKGSPPRRVGCVGCDD